MKILSVKFQNLNSLTGTHEIRFDQPPFTESGLFAITGPTGSGKTTILDAITAALYGRVHRHNKDVQEIMSRHTAECYAEVEFEVKEKSYRAKWSLRRSRGKADGAFQSEKMELADIATGQFLGGHTSTLTRQAIVDLCGLDYNQFLRSVILSQGDFTRFLKADDNERSELLEKITDSGIYSDISRYVYEKQKAEKEKTDHLGTQLAGVEVWSEEERKAYLEKHTTLQTQEKQWKEAQAALTVQLTWLRHLATLREKKTNVVAELAAKQQLQQERQPDFDRLKKHQKALHFRPALVEISSTGEQVHRLQTLATEQNQLLPAYQKEQQTASLQLEKARQAVEKNQQQLTNMEPVLQKTTQLDSHIEHVKLQVEKYRQQLAQTAENVNKLKATREQRLQHIVQLEQELAGLESWLNTHILDKELEKALVSFRQQHAILQEINIALQTSQEEKQAYEIQQAEENRLLLIDTAQAEQYTKEQEEKQTLLNRLHQQLETALKEKTTEELEAELSHLPSLISRCEQQYRLAEIYKKNIAGQLTCQENLSELSLAHQQQSQALELLQQEKTGAENHLADLRQLAEIAQRVQDYETARKQLRPEQPCPLCGSVHHPYAAGSYPHEQGEAAGKRDAQELFVASLQLQYNNQNISLNTLKITRDTRQQELDRYRAEAVTHTLEFEQNNLLLPKPLDINNPEIILAIVRQKKQQQEQLQQQLTQWRAIKKQEDEVQVTLTSIRESLLSSQTRSETLREKIRVSSEALQRISGIIAQHQEKKQALAATIQQLLTLYQITFDDTRTAAIAAELTQRQELYNQSLQRLQQMKINHIQAQTELANTIALLAERSAEQEKQEQEWQQEKEKLSTQQATRRELFGEQDPTAVREAGNLLLQQSRELKEQNQLLLQQKQEQVKITESKLTQYKEELSAATQTLQQLTAKLLDQLVPEQILSLDALRSLFLPEETAQQLTVLEKEISTGMAASKELLRVTEAELQAETARNLSTETESGLLPQIETLEMNISRLQQELGGLNHQLAEDDRLKTKYAEIKEQLALQKKEFDRWARLNELIGSADGKKFRRFAQGLTLARLTDLANRHLARLSDRYRILKSKANDLELRIIDGYQADVTRPMATLSGGESFLVSLALALGLSDLASRKVQINSLFIDEGFGTLDTDTLDVAISALENLQARGKTIGIISHVEALKERIGTQIQLSRQPGGSSKIRIRSYMGESSET